MINSLGLDFGTTNSSVGYVDNFNIPRLVLINEKTSEPSYIFIRNDGYSSVGWRALEDFLKTKESRSTTFHFIPSIKAGLPLDYYSGIRLNLNEAKKPEDPKRIHFSIESLASLLIKDLKTKAEKELKREISNVVLGRPVVFSKDEKLDSLAQTRLERSAKLAGFKNVTFMYEPVAAALHYSQYGSRKKNENIVFIFDFGGGTLDTCVLKLNTTKTKTLDNFNTNILATHGIRLGGSDLDKDIFQDYVSPLLGSKTTWGNQSLALPHYILSTITEWHLTDYKEKMDLLEFLSRVSHDPYTSDSSSIKRLISVIRKQSVYQILADVEKTKIKLSKSKSGCLFNKEIDLNLFIYRKDYESAIRYRKRQIRECIEETLSKANLKRSEIGMVLKVGGSSYNPFVNQILRGYFNNIEEMNVFTNVVSGLTLAAKMLYS